MRSRRAQALLTVVTFVLGLLLVVQLRAAGGGGLENESAQELTTLIANHNLHNGQLRAEIGELEGRLREVRDASARGEGSVEELRSELARLRLWSGLEPVQGSGAIVTFEGPVHADAVNDTLNELLLAGAEAIAVEEVRVVPGTVVTGQPGALVVEGTTLRQPLQVFAVGIPANLAAILSRPGGLVGRIQVTQPEVRVTVREIEQLLRLPATRRNLAPVHGRPRL